MRRVVFIHDSGLREIVGTAEGMHIIPSDVPNFPLLGRFVHAKLQQVTDRAVYYKEHRDESRSTDSPAADSASDSERGELGALLRARFETARI